MSDIAVRFEAYCVSGTKGQCPSQSSAPLYSYFLPGVVDNYVQSMLKLKSDTAALILDRLRKIFYLIYYHRSLPLYIAGTAANVNVPRMYYKNFDDNITAKYGVVCKGWPLAKFCSPADIGSRNEVEILYNAWKTDTTTFQRLTSDEWASWNDARFRNALEEMGNGATVSDGTDEPAGPHEVIDSTTTTLHDTHDAPTTLGLQLPIPTQPGDTTATSSKRPVPPDDSNPSGSKKRKMAPLTDSAAINTLTSITGTPLTITKKPRKQHSDIGKKRGPRKSANTSRTDTAGSTSG